MNNYNRASALWLMIAHHADRLGKFRLKSQLFLHKKPKNVAAFTIQKWLFIFRFKESYCD